jgi:hypothetical protein
MASVVATAVAVAMTAMAAHAAAIIAIVAAVAAVAASDSAARWEDKEAADLILLALVVTTMVSKGLIAAGKAFYPNKSDKATNWSPYLILRSRLYKISVIT